jgi:peptidoglycan/LPS O-acetylase OafA/YrhL
MTEAKNNRLAELDALRGIAAMAVVLFHFLTRYPEMSPVADTSALGFPYGKFGVEIFFGISGFVIFMTLSRTKSVADFLVSRFARLFPAYWVAIIVTTVCVHALGAGYLFVPSWAVLTNFSMLQGHVGLPQVDGVYWSLTIELSFYAVMIALWRLRLLNRIEWALGCWIALKLLWWLPMGLSWRVGYALILDYIPYFAIGVAAYRVWNGERRWIQQLPLLVLGFASVCLDGSAAFQSIYALSVLCFFAISLNWMRFLNHPVLIWFGAISYTVYLVHQHVGYAIMDVLYKHGIIGPWAILIALSAVITLAWLITRFVERPALERIRYVWRNRKEMISQQKAAPASQ